MRGFNFDKHQESEINLVSHFPAEDPPSRRRYRVCCGIFRKQLAPDTVGNPSHFGMRGREGGREVRPGIRDGPGLGCWRGEERSRLLGDGGGGVDGGVSAWFPCGRNPLT